MEIPAGSKGSVKSKISMEYNESGQNVSRSFHNFSTNNIVSNAESVIVLQDIIFVLDEFGVPTIVTLGVISNLLVGVTIRNSPLKNVAVCCYYLAMSIVDTIYLLAMFVPWISLQWIDIYNREGFCQLVVYLNLLTTFLSSWFMVMLLIERFYVCFRPLKAKRYFSGFRTKCYITVVSVFSIVGHLYLTWTSGVYIMFGQSMCTVITENAKDIIVVRKVDTVFSFILPVLTCLLLIMVITVRLCSQYLHCKSRLLTFETKRLTVEVRVKSYSFKQTRSNTTIRSAKPDKDKLMPFVESKRLSVVSLIVAFIYVILFIPHNIIKARMTYATGIVRLTIYDRSLLKLFEELFKINFAYKGLLFFVTLPEMRKNFLKVILGLKTSCKKKPDTKRKDDQSTAI